MVKIVFTIFLLMIYSQLWADANQGKFAGLKLGGSLDFNQLMEVIDKTKAENKSCIEKEILYREQSYCADVPPYFGNPPSGTKHIAFTFFPALNNVISLISIYFHESDDKIKSFRKHGEYLSILRRKYHDWSFKQRKPYEFRGMRHHSSILTKHPYKIIISASEDIKNKTYQLSVSLEYNEEEKIKLINKAKSTGL